MQTIVKVAAERYPLMIDFLNRLPGGTTIATGTLTAVHAQTNADVTADFWDSGTATINGTQVSGFLKMNTVGKYRATYTITLSPGSPAPILVEDIQVVVVPYY